MVEVSVLVMVLLTRTLKGVVEVDEMVVEGEVVTLGITR